MSYKKPIQEVPSTNTMTTLFSHHFSLFNGTDRPESLSCTPEKHIEEAKKGFSAEMAKPRLLSPRPVIDSSQQLKELVQAFPSPQNSTSKVRRCPTIIGGESCFWGTNKGRRKKADREGAARCCACPSAYNSLRGTLNLAILHFVSPDSRL